MEKKYLDLTGLQDVASHVNTRLKTVTTIPVSADDGAVRLYVGETNVNYTKGHIYQYDLANTQWNDITGSSGGGAVDSVNGKTGNVVLNAKDIGLQYDTMPTASVAYENQIVQYTGTTNASYTNGYFYKCVEDSGVYSWVLVADFALASDVYTKTQVGALTDLPDTSKNIVQNIDAINTAVDDKADKVSSATNGDLAGLDSNGNLTDSGILATNVIVKSNTAGLVKNDGTIDESTYLTSADIADKADVVSGATNGDLAGLDASGNLTDSGILATDVVQKSSTSGLLKNDGTVDTNTYLTATDISDKANMVSSATNGDLAGLDSNGDLTDSGIAATNVIVKSNTTGLVKNDGTIDTNTYLTSADIADKADIVDGATVDDFATLDASGNLTDSGINKNIVPSNASSSNKLATANDIPDEINDLDDVEVTNPVNAQILAYNSTSGKWENQTGQAAIGGAVFKGSINFANLPTTGMINGDWYDIKDAFTTDNRFEEGSGIACAAGTDVIWVDTDSKWNILTPSGVYSFNGRVGAVVPASGDYDASDIDYDNTTSGLTATDVQDAIDEINTNVSGKADKVTNATNGHLANLNSSGNLTDSGVASDDVIIKSLTAGLVKNDGTIDTTTYANDFDVVVNRDTLGAQRYNLYYENFPAGEKDGVTLTNGSVGYYSFKGTPTSEYASFKASPIELEEGSYRVTGCPSGGGSSTYQLLAFSTNVYPPSLVATDNGDGADIEVGWNSGIYLELRVYGEVASSKPFNPMIAHSDYNGNYQVAIKPLQRQITIIDNKKPDYETIANLFDSSISYAVGDYCVTNQVLYRCTTAHTGGWNPAHFTAVNVCDELELKASQSDVSSKADLTDIAPAFSTNISYSKGDYVTYNGDVYIFDSAHSGAWNNMDAHTIKITEEIKKRQIQTSFNSDDFNVIESIDLEGHPTNYNVSLNRAQNIDMVDDGVTSGSQVYNAIQGATGNLQDNIKANTQLISESIWGESGKNLLKNTGVKKVADGITYTINADGTVTADGTATADVLLGIKRHFDGHDFDGKILSGCPAGGGSTTYDLYMCMENSPYTHYADDYGTGAIVECPSSVDCQIVIRVRNGQTVNNLVFYPMLRDANILDPTFEPYHESVKDTLRDAEVIKGKNLLAPPYTDGVYKSASNITFTVNSDGTISTNSATASADVYFILRKYTVSELPKGNYIYSIGSTSASYNAYIQAYSNGTWVRNLASLANTDNVSFNVDYADYDEVRVSIRVNSGKAVANVTFYPMIRLATEPDPTYEPYYIPLKDSMFPREEQKVLGAKNFLKNIRKSHEQFGITWSVDNNGIITANGTNTDNSYFQLYCDASNDNCDYQTILDTKSTYILSGNSQKWSDEWYMCLFLRVNHGNDTNTYFFDNGYGATVDLSQFSDINFIRLYCRVGYSHGAQTLTNYKFYPMLRLATDPDDSYVPYTKTNKKLTDEIDNKVNWDDAGKSIQKNLIPFPYPMGSRTTNGVTFTLNNDGSISTSGTCNNSNGATYYLWQDAIPDWLEDGVDYILTGCPSSGSTSTYMIQYNNWTEGTNYQVHDVGNGTILRKITDSTLQKLRIWIKNGVNTDGLVFRPMIRKATVLDDTYEKNVPNNAEVMTWKVNALLGAKNLNKSQSSFTFVKSSARYNSFYFNNTATVETNYRVSFDFSNISGYNGTVALYVRFGNGMSNDAVIPVSADSGHFDVILGCPVNTNSLYCFIPANEENSATITISNVMICSAEDTDKTYVPYAMTNKELTDNKANKVSSATNGNFAGLDASGNLTDSGKSSSSFLPNNYLEQTVTTTANTDTTVTFTNNTITSDKVIEVFAGRSGGDVSGSQNVFPYKDIYVDGTNHTCTITYPALDTAISMKVRIYIY